MKKMTKAKVNGKPTTQKRPDKKIGSDVTTGRNAKFPSRDKIATMLSARGEITDDLKEKVIDAIEFVMRGPLNTKEVGEVFLGLWESKAANGESLIGDDFASNVFRWPPGHAERLALLYKGERWAEIEVESKKLGFTLSKANTVANENMDVLSGDGLEKKLSDASAIGGEQKKKVLDLLEVIVRTPLKQATVATEFYTLCQLGAEIGEKELDKIIESVLGFTPGKARSLALAVEDRWMAQQSNAPGNAGVGQIKSENPIATKNGKTHATKPEDDNQNSDGDHIAPSGKTAAGEDTTNPVPESSNETPGTVKYEDHPYASIFPLDDGEPFDQLTDDVRGNGLREPIVLFESKILDGRRRYRACLRSGTEPAFVQFEGSDPAAFVLSKNIHRRNLEKGQRAAIAAELLLAIEKEVRERTGATNGSTRNNQGRFSEKPAVERIPPTDGNQEADKHSTASESEKSRDKAGKALDVNPRYVSDAKAIMENAADLHEQLKQGKISLPQAKREFAKRQPKKESKPKKASNVEPQPFTVLLWDQSQKDIPMPEILKEKKKRKTLVSAVVFHLTAQPKFAPGCESKDGFCDAALFVAPVDSPEGEKEDHGSILQEASCLFVVARTCGEVPNPEIVSRQIINGGVVAVRETIEKMWPAARRIISNANGIPPEGWQVG